MDPKILQDLLKVTLLKMILSSHQTAKSVTLLILPSLQRLPQFHLSPRKHPILHLRLSLGLKKVLPKFLTLRIKHLQPMRKPSNLLRRVPPQAPRVPRRKTAMRKISHPARVPPQALLARGLVILSTPRPVRKRSHPPRVPQTQLARGLSVILTR